MTWLDYLKHWVSREVKQGLLDNSYPSEFGFATPPPMLTNSDMGAGLMQLGTVAASVTLGRKVRRKLRALGA